MSNYNTLQKAISSITLPCNNKYSPKANNNTEYSESFNKYENNNDNNLATNSSNIFRISLNSEKKGLNESQTFDRFALTNRTSKLLKPLNEDNFDKKPTIEFYKTYCCELENTIEDLTENMIQKTEKLNEMQKIETENLELKRKMKMFTKIISLSQASEEGNICEDEICIANKLNLCNIQIKYDKILKNNSRMKLNKLVFNE